MVLVCKFQGFCDVLQCPKIDLKSISSVWSHSNSGVSLLISLLPFHTGGDSKEVEATGKVGRCKWGETVSRGKEKIIQTQFLRHYKKIYFFFSTSWLSSYSYFAIRFRERKRNTFFFKIFAVASSVAVQIRNILLFFLARKIRGKGCVWSSEFQTAFFIWGDRLRRKQICIHFAIRTGFSHSIYHRGFFLQSCRLDISFFLRFRQLTFSRYTHTGFPPTT